jgi:hypothetical protein
MATELKTTITLNGGEYAIEEISSISKIDYNHKFVHTFTQPRTKWFPFKRTVYVPESQTFECSAYFHVWFKDDNGSQEIELPKGQRPTFRWDVEPNVTYPESEHHAKPVKPDEFKRIRDKHCADAAKLLEPIRAALIAEFQAGRANLIRELARLELTSKI